MPRSGAKRQLAFYGGSFTAIHAAAQEELLGAAAEAIGRGEIDSIRLSTRPDAIDGAVLERLRRFGVETIELGAQSMDGEVLRLSGRGHTAEDVERAAAAVRSAGFRLILQMMTGLPGDSEEKDLETARRLIALRPDGVRIYPTVIVRGTPLWEQWRRGAYRAHTVEEAVAVCAKLLPLFEAAHALSEGTGFDDFHVVRDDNHPADDSLPVAIGRGICTLRNLLGQDSLEFFEDGVFTINWL